MEEMIHRYLMYYSDLLYYAYKKIDKSSKWKKEKIVISLTNDNTKMKKSKNTLEILNFFYRELNCYDTEKEAFLTKLYFEIIRKLLNNRKNELYLAEIKYQCLKILSKISQLNEFYPFLYEYMDNDQFTELVKNVIQLNNKKDNYSLISEEELQTIKNQFCEYDFKTYSHLHLFAFNILMNYIISFKLFTFLKIKKF